MSSLTRFECPRCQHVFVAAVGDDAFADCPQCKSMALAVGDATSAGMSFDSVPASPSQAPLSLPSVESGPQYSTSGEGVPAADDARGVFTNLLDSTSAFDVEVDHTSENLRAPPISQPASGERAVSAEGGKFDESTAAMSVDLELLRLSLQRDAEDKPPSAPPNDSAPTAPPDEAHALHAADDDDEIARAPTDILRPSSAETSLTTMEWEEPAATGDLLARQQADPSSDAASPSSSVSAEGSAPNAAMLLTRAEPAARAVLLSDLEAQLDGGVRIDEATAGMSGQELSALEQAFSAMAGAAGAPPAPSAPGGDAKGAPALRRKRGGPRLLSEEAKALAGVPLEGGPAPTNLAHQLTRAPDAAVRGPARPAPASSSAPTPPREPVPAAGASSAQRAATDGAPARPRRAQLPPPPGPFAGFTVLRIAALVLGGTVLGFGAGALVAPTPETPPVTPRSQAEAQLSQGNRFYQEGRFDDALGSYRGAVAYDDTFPAAHRAKGVALAKQQRGEEAAEAYRRYLELAPDAPDAAQVREVLVRFEGTEGAP